MSTLLPTMQQRSKGKGRVEDGGCNRQFMSAWLASIWLRHVTSQCHNKSPFASWVWPCALWFVLPRPFHRACLARQRRECLE